MGVSLATYGSAARDVFGLLAEHRPEVFHGLVTMRRRAVTTGPRAALPPKTKELMILAIEIAARKTNPPPTGAARRAVAAGATMAEIVEVLSLCLLMGGLSTFVECGLPVLQMAQELTASPSQAAGQAAPVRG